MIIADPVNGCAGDMIIAAMADLGTEGVLDFAGYVLEASGADGTVGAEKFRQGTRLRVRIERDVPDFEEAYERCLKADMPGPVKDFAKRTIDTMIGFEMEIHGRGFHLHELDSADTLMDVFTAAYCLERHGFEAASLPISVGSGMVRTAHGHLENPPPLSRKLLESRGFPYSRRNINFEIATPTGIAILSALKPVTAIEGKVIRTGRGYGRAGLAGHENCLLVHEVRT